MKAHAYWLLKSEPEVFSISDLANAPRKTSGWEGVRNYMARNNLRAMMPGDRAFFYHSNAKPSGIAGVVEVVVGAYPDPTQFDPKDSHFDPKATPGMPIWFQVDVRLVDQFPRLLSLDELRGIPALKDMALFKFGRLSVSPVTPMEWTAVLRALGAGRMV